MDQRSPVSASLLALALTLAPALVTAPAFGPADQKKLDAGEVLIKPVPPSGGSGIAVKAAALIDAPPERVFSVVDDCGHFHEFMPRTEKSEERSRTADRSICFVEISMPFPFSNLWSETEVVRAKRPDGGWSRQWRLVRGSYKKNSGSWTLLPHGEGRTLAIYRLDTEPDIALPDALIRSAQAGSLPDVFTAVRKRLGAR